MQYPHYSVPKMIYLDLAVAAVLGQRRRFRAHAERMMGGEHPPLQVLGTENIPQNGPGVITMNHYFRPGFWPPWFAAAITVSVPVDIYWTMASALTFPGERLRKMKRWVSGLVLELVASIYGFNSMPPMPPEDNEIVQRAAAVSRLVRYIRANPNGLVAMAPEGGDQPEGVLNYPPKGFGRLAMALARSGMPFYPVGVWEEGNCFFLRFGAPYLLENRASPENPDEVDLWAARQVMLRIAECLPGRLQGIFR